jgi:S-adenosylhomocysteine hydrolase
MGIEIDTLSKEQQKYLNKGIWFCLSINLML